MRDETLIEWIKGLCAFLVAAVLIFFFATFIIHSMATSLCDKYETQPIRYEAYGLFGELKEIPTTEANADGYGKVCIKPHQADFFDIFGNINYIVEKNG